MKVGSPVALLALASGIIRGNAVWQERRGQGKDRGKYQEDKQCPSISLGVLEFKDTGKSAQIYPVRYFVEKDWEGDWEVSQISSDRATT